MPRLPFGDSSSGSTGTTALLVRAALVVLLVVGVAWIAGRVLLLLFTALLIGVLIAGASRRLMHWLHLPRGVAVTFVAATVAFVLPLTVWLILPDISMQFDELLQQIPKAADRVGDYLVSLGVEPQLVEHGLARAREAGGQAWSKIASGLFTATSSTLTGLGEVVFVLMLGVYLAVGGDSYREGFLRLLPPERRPRLREVLHEAHHTLEIWLLTKLLAMVIIGVVTTTGLLLLGIPLAMMLGLLAGLLEFLPNIGPILAFLPALGVALSQGIDTVLWVVGLYLAIQMFESYLLTPLLERRTVDLPPAITLSSQLVMATFFGGLGLALASPLAAVGLVFVKRLWIEDVIGEPPEDEEGEEADAPGSGDARIETGASPEAALIRRSAVAASPPDAPPRVPAPS